jgi:dynein heavy chain
MDLMALQPAQPGTMFASLPLIHFLPTTVTRGKSTVKEAGQADQGATAASYRCPLYRTSQRAGVLTTTGASSNYVLDIKLPIERDPDFYVLQGTAALCQLND